MVRRGQFQRGPLNPSRRIDGLGQPHDAAYLYWLRLWDERREGSEWIRYPARDTEKATGLSRAQVEWAKGKCVELGIIEFDTAVKARPMMRLFPPEYLPPMLGL